MKSSVLFYLIFTALILTSCQEKVSSDLPSKKDSTGSGNGSSSQSIPATRSFSLEHNMEADLSHYLHKTGAGNANTPCKATKTGTFDPDDPTLIDCYLEVEELDLYFNGANFTFKANAGSCEYLAYRPYLFFKLQPGHTRRVIKTYNCDTDCGTCPTSDDVPNCSYDYSKIDEQYPNCDTGTIVNITYDVEGIECEQSVNPNKIQYINCNGSMVNCAAGDTETIDLDSYARYLIIKADEEAISYDVNLSAPMNLEYVHNFNIANFTRACYAAAGNDSDVTTPATSSYASLQTYDSDVLANYPYSATQYLTPANFNNDAANADGDTDMLITDIATSPGTDIADTTARTMDLAGSAGANGLVTADDPFRGYNPRSDVETSQKIFPNPYYEFYCLDRALETRARIRLMIRDWDRDFSTSYTYLSYVSDVFRDTNGVMDSNGTQSQVIWGQDYNDYDDWDNFLTGKIETDCSEFTTPGDPGNFPLDSYSSL